MKGEVRIQEKISFRADICYMKITNRKATYDYQLLDRFEAGSLEFLDDGFDVPILEDVVRDSA